MTTPAQTEAPENGPEDSGHDDDTSQQQQQAPAKGADSTDDEKPELGDPGKKALEAERKARKAAEKAARDLENRLKAIEEKDLSEQEKVIRERDSYKTKYDELAGELQAMRAEQAFAAAIKAEKVAPENENLVLDLVKTSDFEEDETGNNAKELIRSVKARYPHLFKTVPTVTVDTGAGKGAAPELSDSRQTMNAWLRGE